MSLALPLLFINLGYHQLRDQPTIADVFVHHSAINGVGHKSLNEGDQVEFEMSSGPKGPSAANLKKVY